MKTRLHLVLLFVIFSFVVLSGQTVVEYQESELMDENYAIDGTAFLEELDNGDLQLRLSDDYSTLPGPDVRILLGNGTGIANTVEIINLSDIGHWNGAETFDVPSSVALDDYTHVIFFCVAFNQLWASGEWGPVMSGGGGNFTCESSTVSLTNGSDSEDICPSDNEDDVIEFENSLDESATGDHYAYLITDDNEVLEAVVFDDEYDFEGSSGQPQRVYGIHYDGDLNTSIGSDRMNTTATGCFEHSSSTDFIEITKDACFECEDSEVFALGGISSFDICPSDGGNDIVILQNSLSEPVGDHYVYLLTDENEILQEVVSSSNYNFEGTSTDEQRVYGMHYDGSLLPSVGSNRIFTTATGCFEHSASSEFIQVTKNACFECNTSDITSGVLTTIDICPSDGDGDLIDLDNSIGVPAGVNYAYLITDVNQILEEVVLTDSYNFEGSSSSSQRVYGIHYDGTLNAAIGNNRLVTTATGCFEHSSATAFLEITKDACFVCEPSAVSSSGNTTIDICPSDGGGDVIALENTLGLSAGVNYAYLITDGSEILEEVVLTDSYDFEGSVGTTQRVYGMHYDGTLNAAVGSPRTSTTASGCFEHSSSTIFLEITKDACFVCEPSDVTSPGSSSLDICPSDGTNDVVVLENSLGLTAGINYAYLITDESEILEEVVLVDSYDFEGSVGTTQRVYGLHYDGTLNAAVGSPRTNTTASGCFEHSSATTFIEITKDACFVCEPSDVTASNGVTTIDICPSDSGFDIVSLENSLNLSATGTNYVYLITDASETLLEVVMADTYDFEGSGEDTQRVYGMHYDGTLNAAVGSPRTSTSASGCFEHSSSTTFIEITKDACPPEFVCNTSSVTSTNGVSSVDICAEDSAMDVIAFVNSLAVGAGTNYAYLITDESEVLQEVVLVDSYDFEGSGETTQRVYGIHFDGTLNAVVGSARLMTTATGCFEHSSSADFLEVTKNACPPDFVCEVTSVTGNSASSLDICSTDGTDDIIALENSLGVIAGDHYVYLITDESEILQEVVSVDTYNFEGSSEDTQRVYGIHFDGTLNPVIGSARQNTTATGCFEHSAASDFLEVTKGACIPDFVCEPNTVTSTIGSTIDICPDDNTTDVVQLENSLGLAAGTNYVYLITDAAEVLQQVVVADSYDFEGSNEDTQRVYGIHFDGTLNPVIGSARSNTTATGCFEHSSGTDFIEITKGACIPDFICEASTVTSSDGSNLDICPDDSTSDIIQLENSLDLSAGVNYAYLITDANEILQAVVVTNQFDFEGSSEDTQRVYGVHFDGNLNPAIGAPRTNTTATGCFEHSSSTDFLEVTKGACIPEFVCESSTISSSGGTSIDICPDDSTGDLIQLENSLNLTPGVNYAYLVTDVNEILQAVVVTNQFDFEGSSDNTQRVYGVHFDGTLNPAIGSVRTNTTASGCFEHSSATDYLEVTKGACLPDFVCEESFLTTINGESTIDICANDGTSDVVAFANSLAQSAGTNYVYLVTDESEILQSVVVSDEYDFEGSVEVTQRVYGVHFNGTLNPAIGSDRTNTTATGCIEHSTSFIEVTKNACIPDFECQENLTATTDWATSVDICASDSVDDIVELRNNLFIPPGEHYAYLITDASEIVQDVVLDSLYNFEGTSADEQRVYGIHFDGELQPVIGQIRTETTATGCFEHSGDNLFLTVTKNGCAIEGECLETLTATTNWVTQVDICANDGEDDLIPLLNNLFIAPGENYAFLLTDVNEVVQEVVLDSIYNFEGTGDAEQRVYGISYTGELQPVIGQVRTETTATGCFIHSGETLFITINKTAGCVSSTADEELDAEVRVFPNPSTTGVINLDLGEVRDVQSIQVYDINGNLYREYEVSNRIEVETSGLYIVRISTQDATISRRIAVVR